MWCETDLLFLFECGACNVGVCQYARTHTINVILTSYKGNTGLNTCPHGFAVRACIRRYCPCTRSILHTYYTILHNTTLNTTQYYTILHNTTLYYTVLHNTTQYYTVYYTILQYTTQYYTILHYTTQYYTILHITTQYYTILHNLYL